MRWIVVPLAALALTGCSGGSDDQPARAEASPAPRPLPTQTPRQAQTPSPSEPQLPVLANLVRDGGPLAPRQWRYALGEPPPLIEAGVVGDTIRYVLKSETPARFLKRGGMSHFLWNFRFGEQGRPMVVRLLDGHGRFAWAARYDGVKMMWVRARSDLARCGSIWNGQGRRLPTARGALEARPCPVEPPAGNTASTVLR